MIVPGSREAFLGARAVTPERRAAAVIPHPLRGGSELLCCFQFLSHRLFFLLVQFIHRFQFLVREALLLRLASWWSRSIKGEKRL